MAKATVLIRDKQVVGAVGGGSAGGMSFQGLLGQDQETKFLPRPTAETNGYVYKVVTDGTYVTADTKYITAYDDGTLMHLQMWGDSEHTILLKEVSGNTGSSGLILNDGYKDLLRYDGYHYISGYYFFTLIPDFVDTSGNPVPEGYMDSRWNLPNLILGESAEAKVGDMFISTLDTWILIPSGDDVTEIPIATTETIGGVKPDGSTIVIDEDGVISSVGEDIPEGTMVYKGTLGTGGDIQILPTPTDNNKGWVYSVNYDGLCPLNSTYYHFYKLSALPQEIIIDKCRDPECTDIIDTKVQKNNGGYYSYYDLFYIDYARTSNYHWTGKTLVDGIVKNGISLAKDEQIFQIQFNETINNIYSYGETIKVHKKDLFISNGIEWVHIPSGDSLPEGGQDGQFLVSDGEGGARWLTLTNTEEVSY